MKQSMLKRALLTACLSVSMAGVAMAGPVGPVIIPQAGDVVVKLVRQIQLSQLKLTCM